MACRIEGKLRALLGLVAGQTAQVHQERDLPRMGQGAPGPRVLDLQLDQVQDGSDQGHELALHRDQVQDGSDCSGGSNEL